MTTCQTTTATALRFTEAVFSISDKNKGMALKWAYYPVMVIEAFGGTVSPAWKSIGGAAKNVKNGLGATKLPGDIVFVIKGLWKHVFVASYKFATGAPAATKTAAEIKAEETAILCPLGEFAVGAVSRVSTVDDTINAVQSMSICRVPVRLVELIKKIGPWCMVIGFSVMAIKTAVLLKAQIGAETVGVVADSIMTLVNQICYLVVGLLGVMKALAIGATTVVAAPLCLTLALMMETAKYLNSEMNRKVGE